MARAGMNLEDQIDRLLNPKLQPPRLKLLGRTTSQSTRRR